MCQVYTRQFSHISPRNLWWKDDGTPSFPIGKCHSSKPPLDEYRLLTEFSISFCACIARILNGVITLLDGSEVRSGMSSISRPDIQCYGIDKTSYHIVLSICPSTLI